MSDYIAVPYGQTVHGQEEIDAVVEVLKNSTQMGKNVRELESKIASLYNKKHGIGVNSGSSALYLAADLMNFEEGELIAFNSRLNLDNNHKLFEWLTKATQNDFHFIKFIKFFIVYRSC